MVDNLVTIIQVIQHKTGQSGSAKLLLSQGDLSRLKSYVEVLCPHCDPNDQCQNLVLPYGKKIGKFNNLLRSLGDKYGINLPSATRVRKIRELPPLRMYLAHPLHQYIGNCCTAVRLTTDFTRPSQGKMMLPKHSQLWNL